MGISVFKRNKRVVVWTGCVLILILCALISVLEARKIRTQWGAYSEISVADCTPYGYEVEGNHYLNIIGDAHIQLPTLNRRINAVTLRFLHPLAQDLDIAVYYAQENHGYSEAYVSTTHVIEGAQEALILLEADVTTMRIDIGSVGGEQFELSSITLNAPSIIRLSQFQVCVKWLIAASVAVSILALIGGGLSSAKNVAGLTLIFGMLYCIVMTPLSPPDEPHHYQSAYQLSNCLMLRLDSLEEGDASHFNYEGLPRHYNTYGGYMRVLEDFAKPEKLEGNISIPTPRDLSYFVEYLPQALGISLGRMLHLNFIRIFYLGRLGNLLFYTVCVYGAVRKAIRFKSAIAMVALMPMSLHQAASYSYDVFINGVAFLLLALLINAIYEGGRLTNRAYAAMAVLGALLAPAKIVYATLLLLALLIPYKRFGNRRTWAVKIFALFMVAGFTILLFQISALVRMSTSATEKALNWEGQRSYDLNFVFNHPVATIKIFVDTVKTYGEYYYNTCLGQILSGLSLTLPSYIVYVMTLLLGLSILEPERCALRTTAWQRTLFVATFAVVSGLIMLSLFLGHTSNTKSLIQGVQGRYFIPVLPLVPMALSNRTIVLKRDILKWQLVAVAILQSQVLFYVLQYTV